MARVSAAAELLITLIAATAACSAKSKRSCGWPFVQRAAPRRVAALLAQQPGYRAVLLSAPRED